MDLPSNSTTVGFCVSLPLMPPAMMMVDPKCIEWLLKTNFDNYEKGSWLCGHRFVPHIFLFSLQVISSVTSSLTCLVMASSMLMGSYGVTSARSLHTWFVSVFAAQVFSSRPLL